MSLWHRYRRWRGADTMTDKVHEMDRYEYEVLHLNGEITRAEGNITQRDEGFLIIREADDDTWAMITAEPHNDMACKPGWGGYRGYDKVKVLEGVQEVNKEKVGVDRWIFTIDKADAKIKNIEAETEYF